MHRRSSNLCNNSVYSGGSCLLNAIVGAVSSSTALTSRGCCTGVWESTARLLRLVDSIQAKRRGGSSRQPARASRWSALGQASGWRGHPGCWAWAGSRRLTAQVRVLPEGRARSALHRATQVRRCARDPRRREGRRGMRGAASQASSGYARRGDAGAGRGTRDLLIRCTDRWCAYRIR